MDIAGWDQRYRSGQFPDAGPTPLLVETAAHLKPGRALDLACGEGQNAIWLAGRGWRVTGVDFSDVAIAKARRRAREEGVELELLCADLLEYEPAARASDLVLLFYLHLPPDERRLVLERAAEAVAPGGVLLLVGHHLENLTAGVGGPQDPALLVTEDDVAAELPGLRVERAERWLREVEGEERPAIDVLVRARRPR